MKDAMAETEPVNGVSAVLARVESVLIGVSGLAMAAIMLIVVVDVTLRYVFAAPLTWSYSLIGLYLAVAMFFLALPDTLNNHGHIALDVFVPLFPRRVRHLTQGLGYGGSTLFVGAMSMLGYSQARDAYLFDNRVAEAVAWPTWIAYALLTVGMTTLCLRCGFRFVFHLASVFSARDLVEMPAPPNTAVKPGEHGE